MSAAGSRAVFLSYASQDAEAARRICAALRAADIEVWFDQNELVGGDAWDAKIRGQIASCALFVPVISAATQARLEGYFRIEWKLAAQRTHAMADEKAFLLPVVIDDTREPDAKVPAEFRAVQWTRLASEAGTEKFCARVRELLAAPDTPVATAVPQSASAARAVRREPRSLRKRLVGVAVFAAIGLVTLLVWRLAGARTANPPPEPLSIPRLGLKSIAVLPFDNLSDDKESGYFADGMQDDVITNLLSIHELRCVPRATAMTYRGTKKTNREIAAELGVAFLLNGTVRRADQKVKITGTLIDARTDEPLWSKAYDKHLTDVFTIQSELAQAIAGELKATLSPAERTLVSRRATEDPGAYDLYLRARVERYNATGGGRETLAKQISLLEAAVQRDATFGLAWAELTRAHALFYHNNHDHSPERLASARTAIENAARFAPDDPEVALNLGFYYLYGFRSYERAIAEFEKYVRLRPTSAAGYLALGSVQRRQARWLDARASFQKAAEFDPAFIDVVAQQMSVEQPLRRYGKARELAGKVADLLRAAGPPSERQKLNGYDLYRAQLGFYESGSPLEWEKLQDQFEEQSGGRIDAWFGRTVFAAELGLGAEVIRLDARERSADWFGTIRAACALAAGGDIAAARQRIGDLPDRLRARLEREPENDSIWGAVARLEALLGHGDEALRCARRATELVPLARDTWYGPAREADLAFVYTWTGDKDRATAIYARLLALPVVADGYTITVHVLKRGVWYAPLRGYPAFEALLADPKNNAPIL
jgi:TolB-like protein/cytochrome c-type biogenesis protein CcmH/NrfG